MNTSLTLKVGALENSASQSKMGRCELLAELVRGGVLFHVGMRCPLAMAVVCLFKFAKTARWCVVSHVGVRCPLEMAVAWLFSAAVRQKDRNDKDE